MARLDETVYNKAAIGDGGVPDFMIAFAVSLKEATCLCQSLFECCHSGAVIGDAAI